MPQAKHIVFSQLFTPMVFGYALITDYPNIPLSGSMMLFGSILMMILTFETGRKLKNLKKMVMEQCYATGIFD